MVKRRRFTKKEEKRVETERITERSLPDFSLHTEFKTSIIRGEDMPFMKMPLSMPKNKNIG